MKQYCFTLTILLSIIFPIFSFEGDEDEYGWDSNNDFLYKNIPCPCNDSSFRILEKSLKGDLFTSAFKDFEKCNDYMDDVNFYPNYFRYEYYHVLQKKILKEISEDEYELLNLMTDMCIFAQDDLEINYVDFCSNPTFLELREMKKLNEIQEDYLDELEDDCEELWDFDLDDYGLLDRYKRADSLIIKFKYTWEEIVDNNKQITFFENNKDSKANVFFVAGAGATLLGVGFIILGTNSLNKHDWKGDYSHNDYSVVPKSVIGIGAGFVGVGIALEFTGVGIHQKNKKARDHLKQLFK